MSQFNKEPIHFLETLKEFRKPLLYLTALLILCGIIYLTDPFSGNWDTDIFGGLATELGGVIVTVLLLESYISQRDKKLSYHRRQVALRSLSIALRRHLSTLFNIFKATSVKAPAESFRLTEVSQFFGDTFLSRIQYLDFAAKAPVIPQMTWAEYLAWQFKDFSDRLENTADKFGLGLTPDDIDLIERLINNPYANSLKNRSLSFLNGESAPLLLSIEKGGVINFVSDKSRNSFYRDLNDYHAALVDLTNSVNQVLRESGKDLIQVVEQWGDHVSPKIGSACYKPY